MLDCRQTVATAMSTAKVSDGTAKEEAQLPGYEQEKGNAALADEEAMLKGKAKGAQQGQAKANKAKGKAKGKAKVVLSAEDDGWVEVKTCYDLSQTAQAHLPVLHRAMKKRPPSHAEKARALTKQRAAKHTDQGDEPCRGPSRAVSRGR